MSFSLRSSLRETSACYVQLIIEKGVLSKLNQDISVLFDRYT